ncbi:MAG: MBL fold metallo-hydrolase, partial [Selenomonas noxia]
MRIEFLGAAHVVTGSCYLLHVGDHRYLVDCGMYQGTRRLREMNYEEFPFNPAEIEAVFLTHAHIDHCGRIPRLVREGFRGKVYATQSTCDLVRIMLPDSAHIQESDTELFNRKNARRSEAPISPLYTQADAFAALELFEPVSYHAPLQVNNLKLVFRDAGHI